MKSRMLLLLLLVLSPLCFAAPWVLTASAGLMIATMLLGLLLMLGYGFGSQELKMIAQDELYQLVVTVLMLGLVITGSTSIDAIAKALTGSPSLGDAAAAALSEMLEEHHMMLVGNNSNDGLVAFSRAVGYESSKSFYCSLHGVGYSISACGSYRQLMPALGLATQALSFSIAELESLRTLVLFSESYMFAILLPAGIIFRTFRITRGAGAFLIAFSVSLYLVLPFTVLGMKEVVDSYNGATISGLPASGSKGFSDSKYVCDEEETGSDAFFNLRPVYNYKKAFKLFQKAKGNLAGYLYAFLIKGTLTTGVSIFAFITGIRWLSRIAGTEVDVSALMRLA